MEPVSKPHALNDMSRCPRNKRFQVRGLPEDPLSGPPKGKVLYIRVPVRVLLHGCGTILGTQKGTQISRMSHIQKGSADKYLAPPPKEIRTVFLRACLHNVSI